MNAATVYIVDDDKAVRDGLRLLLETADFNVQCFANGESFLQALRPETRGCLLLDVEMGGGMNGEELQAELNRRGNRLPIIYLTAHGSIRMTVRAMKAGAENFLTKPVDGEELIRHIHDTLQRYQAVSQQQRELEARKARLQRLTPREREILLLVLAGKDNKTIARELHISHRTVEIHRSHILHKTGECNMLGLADLAGFL
jgi:FixJ family two-component response regulator